MNKDLYNDRYVELSKQLENLENMKKNLTSSNGRIVSDVADGLTDSFSTQKVDNSRKLYAINQEIERIKKERDGLANAQRDERTSDLKEKIDSLKRTSDEEIAQKHELFESVKKRYKSASVFTRLIVKLQGGGLKKEAAYTMEELKFLESYDRKKPKFMTENINKTREKMEKAGADSKKINKAVSQRHWDQFAKAVADKALLHRQMEMDRNAIR